MAVNVEWHKNHNKNGVKDFVEIRGEGCPFSCFLLYHESGHISIATGKDGVTLDVHQYTVEEMVALRDAINEMLEMTIME